jgi:hypothetical protein
MKLSAEEHHSHVVRVCVCSDVNKCILVVSQVRKMKNRTHMLNKKLLPIVDRKDTRVLEKDLEPKREFVISIRMTPNHRTHTESTLLAIEVNSA